MATTTSGLRYPDSGTAPDGPGAIYNLATDTDNLFRAGGAEYCANANAVFAIPSSRLYRGKTAYSADTDTVYRFNGTAWIVWSGDGSGALTRPGTITDIGGGQVSRLTREGRLVTLNVEITTGSGGLGANGTIFNIPIGWRPLTGSVFMGLFAFLTSDGGTNGTVRAHVAAGTGNNSGALIFDSYSDKNGSTGTSFGGNFRIEGLISYPGEN